MSPSSLSPSAGNGEKPPRPIVVVEGSIRPQLLASLTDEVTVLESRNLTAPRIDALIICEPAIAAAATGATLGYPVIRLGGDSSAVESGEIALPPDVDAVLFRRVVLDAIRIGALERELVESREECERNAARFAAAMSAARSGTWRRDIRTAVVEWSPELHEIFGLEPGTFGGTEEAFYDFVHPDDREAVSGAIREALAKRSNYEVEFRYLHSSGEYRWMAGRGRGFFDTDGNLIELAGVGIDITDRKRAEGELRDREIILRQIGDNFPDGALYQVLASPDGTRKFVYIGSAM
jgi:PAS domain S-box-containing protein